MPKSESLAGERRSNTDTWLERISKIAGIFVPIVLAWYAHAYTVNKDENDKLDRLVQDARADDQKSFDNASRRYQNMAALLPLLTSKDKDSIFTGIEIFTSEANAGQAPLDLQVTIERIKGTLSDKKMDQAADQALTAAKTQSARDRCFQIADGIYIHVANSVDQKAAGAGLARALTSTSLPVQGVQRIDVNPNHTEIRYYFSLKSKPAAQVIKDRLIQLNFTAINEVDLTQKYLGKGCTAPMIFEVWIGKNDELSPDGSRK
jgi:hypothetical protein